MAVLLASWLMPSLAPAKELNEPDDIVFVGGSESCTTYLNGQIHNIYTISLCAYAIKEQEDEIKSTVWTFEGGGTDGKEWVGGWEFLNQYYGASAPGSGFGTLLIALAWCVDTYADAKVTTLYQGTEYAAGMWKFGGTNLCPHAKADVTFATSTSATPPQDCPKQTWCRDDDGDDYGNPHMTKWECLKPAGYTLDCTDECDDFIGGGDFKKPMTWCVDADNDGWPSTTTLLACASSSKQYPEKPGYPPDGASLCADVLLTKCKTDTGEFCKSYSGQSDCNDNSPTANKKLFYCKDHDGDGYCSDQMISGCSAEDVSIELGEVPEKVMLASQSKGIDCDDNANWKHPKAAWAKDKDWDGFHAGIKIQCEDPGNVWYNVAWQKQYKGKEFKPGDCDDSANWKYPGAKWVPDADGDGYNAAENFWKTQCQDPDVDSSGATICSQGGTNYCWDPKSMTTKKPGDCKDTDAQMHGATVWVFDKDQDSYYDDSQSVTQCQKPTNVASYLSFIKDGKIYQEKKLQKGDCDDDNATITWLTYAFDDYDGDGRGDPNFSVAVSCAADNQATSGNMDGGATSPYPNDFDDMLATGNMQENILSGYGSYFIIAPDKPLVPCNTKPTGSPQPCVPEGTLCQQINLPNGTPVIECMPQAWLQEYCPQRLISPWGGASYLPEIGKFLESAAPYGTVYPIVTEANVKETELSILPATGDMLLNCLLESAAFQQIMNYFIPIYAQIMVKETGEIYALAADYTSGQYQIIPVTGKDYKLDLPSYTSSMGLYYLPIIFMGQEYFQLLATAETYADRVDQLGWSAVPIDMPPEYDTSIPWYLYGENVYQVPLSPAYEPWLEITNGLGKLPLRDDPSLRTLAKGIETDTDGDGWSDWFEINLTGLPPPYAMKVAGDKNLKIAQLDSDHVTLPQWDLTADELFLWQAAKDQAQTLVGPIYAYVQATLAKNPDVLLLLTPEEWQEKINKAQPVYVWKSPEQEAVVMMNPGNLRRKVLGVEAGCGPENKDICVDFRHIMALVTEETDSAWVLDQLTNDSNIINVTALILGHEVLHGHIEPAPTANDPTNTGDQKNDLEHLHIYAIQHMMLDFGWMID